VKISVEPDKCHATMVTL